MSLKQLDEAAIFEIARNIPARNVRADYVEQACGNNTALRARIDALLDALDNQPDFLEPALSSVDATEQLTEIDERPGTVISKYKLMEQIGEGGFGVVYVAEQDRPVHRKVALKVIKPGMDTKEVSARFEAERQALALMDHPNIAKVFDAGATDSGRPYFVMELVRGIGITEYCDRKRLGTQDRLELFVTVCQAVQHAHQKGVIHRDLKPSNILITEHDGTPVPKIIDFGVAKAINQRLTERTIYTRHQQMVGTPLYMSPEQAELSGLDVDTRTDIYSLGVLLYELLTGTTPFDRNRFHIAAYDEIRRIIREEDPPKPSTRISTLGDDTRTITEHRKTDIKRLGHLLRGELDWIVMKALEKDRNHRYETASAFAEDIRRHLSDEPVMAGPPSTAYRLRKFVRRKRGLVLAGAVIGIALLLGISASLVGFFQARYERNLARVAQLDAEEASDEAQRQRTEAQSQRAQAQRERDEARSQQQRAESVQGLMTQMLLSGGLSQGRSKDYSVRQMLDEFSETLDVRFEENPQVGADIWLTIGDVYHSMEEMDKANQARRRALELARHVYKDQPLVLAHYLSFLAFGLTEPSMNEAVLLHTSEVEKLLEESLSIYEELGIFNMGRYDATLMLIMNKLLQHEYSEMEALTRKAIELQEHLSPQESLAYVPLAGCLARQNHELDGLITIIDDAIPIMYERLADAEQENPERARLRRMHLGEGISFKAYLLFEQGRLEEADRCLEECLNVWKVGTQYATRLFVDPACVRAWTKLRLGRRDEANKILDTTLLACEHAKKSAMEAEVLHYLARMSLLDGSVKKAEDYLRRAVETCQAAYGNGHIDTIRATIWLAQHYQLLGQPDEAGSIIDDILTSIEAVVHRSRQNAEWVARLAWAKSHSRSPTQADLADAIGMAETALERIGRFGYYPRYVNVLPHIAIAKAHMQSERWSDAIATLRQGLRSRHVLCVYEWLTVEQWLLDLLIAKGDADEVEEVLRESVEFRIVHLTDTHPMTLEATVKLAAWLVDQQRPHDAEQMLDKCQELADNEEASKNRRRFAIETGIRLNRALSQPESVEVWRVRLSELEQEPSNDGSF